MRECSVPFGKVLPCSSASNVQSSPNFAFSLWHYSLFKFKAEIFSSLKHAGIMLVMKDLTLDD